MRSFWTSTGSCSVHDHPQIRLSQYLQHMAGCAMSGNCVTGVCQMCECVPQQQWPSLQTAGLFSRVEAAAAARVCGTWLVGIGVLRFAGHACYVVSTTPVATDVCTSPGCQHLLLKRRRFADMYHSRAACPEGWPAVHLALCVIAAAIAAASLQAQLRFPLALL